MPCNCKGRRTVSPSPSKGVKAGSQMIHEVYTASGKTTGRRFTSLVAAQRYASGITGAVVVSS